MSFQNTTPLLFAYVNNHSLTVVAQKPAPSRDRHGADAQLLVTLCSDPFTRCLDAEPAQRVAGFRVAPAVQEKVPALAERANDGALTEDERATYEALINAADLIAVLKPKARRMLTPDIRQ
jgi:hypothetical protein